MTPCEWCGRPFKVSKYTPRIQRFCSRSCQVTSLYHQGRVDGSTRTKGSSQR